MNEIILLESRVFRTTPGVSFTDLTVENSNGLDLVEHTGPSVSPPDRDKQLRWYCHLHQTDNNRVIAGERLFELFNPHWTRKHWYVYLDADCGALTIPPGTFHRSYSGSRGSVLLNHAVRDWWYDEHVEFVPCFCPAALDHSPHYHGISPWGVTTFINHGEYS